MTDSSLSTSLRSASSLDIQRDRLRQSFETCRAVTLRQFETLDDSIIATQAHPDFSPSGWHLGHIAYTESLWLLETCGGFPCQFPEYNRLLAADGLPKEQRQNLPLLSELLQYLQVIRTQTLRYLDTAPLDRQQRLWDFILQHESQHGETIAIVLALLQPQTIGLPPRSRSSLLKSMPQSPMIHVPAGAFTMGYDGIDALDNERPAHRVYLDDYWIDAYPVTCSDFAKFIDAGGYENPEWWTDAGWQWRCHHNIIRPLYWRKDMTSLPTSAVETSPLASEHSPLIADDAKENSETSSPEWAALPVCGVSWYEADAYARFVGKRLPSEAEWEKVARWDPSTGACSHYPWGNASPQSHHANHQHRVSELTAVNAYPEGQSALGCWDLLGNVWEWTSSWFAPYQGFTPYPYEGYSKTYFDLNHRVLRGGSWATRQWGLRASFRNWYHPHVRQIFAGFRCARS